MFPDGESEVSYLQDPGTNNVPERSILEQVARTYTPVESCLWEQAIRRFAIRTFTPYIHRGRALELGCGVGFTTELIAGIVDLLDVVEGSRSFIEKAKGRNLPNVRFYHALFEEFNPRRNYYDAVFAMWVLEHVQDPAQVLRIAHLALKPDGLLFVVVPNANALSRQLARHMGLIEDLKSLTENDLRHGHRRVYDRVSLNRELTQAGFTLVSQGGLMLKPFADFQMEQLIRQRILEEPQLEGLWSLGFEYPDLCGSLYAICSPSQV